jgi:hypothetical protein
MNRSSEDFEASVGATLATLARVEDSTLADTRAFIAALPDRRPRKLALPRLAQPWTRRWPVRLAAAGLGLIAIVVAASAFGGWNSAPAASPSSAPLPSPSRELTLLPSSSPIVFATPTPETPAFHETLPVVMTGEQLFMLGWSPDGSMFAVAERPKGSPSQPSEPTVHIFDRSGAEQSVWVTPTFAWLDSSSFVEFMNATAPDDTIVERAYVCQVGQSVIAELPGTYDGLVSGPSGAVALMLPWNGTPETTPQYAVIADGAVGPTRNGYPMAWSRDGSELAVFHPTGPPPPRGIGTQVIGWIEVVASTGESVGAARDVSTSLISQAEFSPDGKRLAFGDDTNAATTGEAIGVLDLRSGDLQRIATHGTFSWANSDELLIASADSSIPSQNSRIVSWSATGRRLAPYATGNVVGASGQGAVIAGMNGSDSAGSTGPASLTFVDGREPSPTTVPVVLGGGVWGGVTPQAWSPDGRSLVLIVGGATAIYQDAVLIRL